MILQIMAAQDSAAVAAEGSSIQIIDLIFKGGIMMIPIFLLSLLGVYIFVERLRTIKQAMASPDAFINQIKELVFKGDISAAKVVCAQSETPMSRMIEKGLTRIGSSLKNIEASIENVGRIEMYRLERNLSLLATIAGAAPMLGFLGTVMGMISAFMSIAQEEGAVSPKLLSSGIYEAMISTAAGLVVGVLAYLAYNYLVTRMQKVIHSMEYSSIEFIEMLQEPK
ncbi:MAG: MotA/TolQ/ExbB proton channel family protein [Bacteroidota bacterium]